MANTEVSIKELPSLQSVENGNFLIIQTDNSTNKIDFKDFVVGLDNVTFKNSINDHTTGLTTLSGVLFPSSVPTETGSATHGIPITINGTDYHILLHAT